jgi:hypothetical protein
MSSMMLTAVLTVSDGDSHLTEFYFVRMPHFNKAREKVCLECSRSSSSTKTTSTHICFVGLMNIIWQLQQSVVYPLMDESDDVTRNVQTFSSVQETTVPQWACKRPNIKG